MADFGSSEAGKKGGKARAAAMTKEQRSEIARAGAQARWGKARHATHMGEIQIGDIILECAVLEDGTRVISQRGMSKALGRVTTGSGTHYTKKSDGDARLPTFLSGKHIKGFVDKGLAASLAQPIEYIPIHGGRTAHGFPAALVPQICDVWLKVRDAKMLTPAQEHIADRAYLLMRGLAHVGIIALVDEATGFQEVRKKDELAAILEAYINEELRPWVHKFPNEFFKQIYRLNNWPYNPGSTKRNQQVGHWINKYIYAQLPPGVLEELKKRNPRNEKGNRPHKNFQLLTADIGNDHLDRLLPTVTTLLRISDTKRDFEENFNKAFHVEQPVQKRLFVEVPKDGEKPKK
jgi:P63C domain